MTADPSTIDALLDAQAAAEADALARHEAGTCHLSEWSCSFCENEEGLAMSETKDAERPYPLTWEGDIWEQMDDVAADEAYAYEAEQGSRG